LLQLWRANIAKSGTGWEGQLQIALPPVVTDRNENQLIVTEGSSNMANSDDGELAVKQGLGLGSQAVY
jgi:hypothetical protein